MSRNVFDLLSAITYLKSEGWRIVRFADSGGIVPTLPNGNQLREVSEEL